MALPSLVSGFPWCQAIGARKYFYRLVASRVAALYGHDRAEECRSAWAAYRRNGGTAAMQRLEEERGALLRRMGDLSKYMKELLCAVSDTPAGGNPAQDAVFRRALALGSKGFILETYARFRQVFNARKRPAEPFVTDIGGTENAICASHKPRKLSVG